ncbi:dATP/dGTP diphosphohydrolase domain-containing protein [Faecalibacterium hattorii]|uniref:dATP/dGTP diphosphohydrolase domain-containing protein n=1 Tax=Faecalibacterium hattorii TaxID=2935520 RepID=UPI0015EB46BD|nr:dATP/dGTP diphosphohydrolase domain-containing protein [Faecalibacterium hattorii]
MEKKKMIKDSGDRTEFETGAKRDMHAGKGRMDLLPWYGIMEVSKHCEEGALKYGEHNVDKGIPLHSLLDSAARHLAKYMVGMDDEDHLRAACWNLLWALNQRETHPELDDRFAIQIKENKKSMKDITCTCGKALTDEHGRAFRDVEQDINLPMLRWMLRCPECKKVTVVNWKEFTNE